MAYSRDNKFGKVVDNILQELPSAIAVAVVDVNTGMALASHSNSPNFNPDSAAAYNSEVVRQKRRAMSALKLTNESLDDILITLTTQLHLIKIVGSGDHFIYLAVNARDTNLAIARAVLREQESNLR
jgi:predicted regulator of Ras-like GTPase activity (Roadblock/LC7/MglB family)